MTHISQLRQFHTVGYRFIRRLKRDYMELPESIYIAFHMFCEEIVEI